jgi:hypothetical protein
VAGPVRHQPRLRLHRRLHHGQKQLLPGIDFMNLRFGWKLFGQIFIL